jgi:hypothetical protein
MSSTKTAHRSPLDFLAWKVGKSSRNNPNLAKAPHELHIESLTGITVASPESPILHTNFRTSVSTTAYSNSTNVFQVRQSYLDTSISPSPSSLDGAGPPQHSSPSLSSAHRATQSASNLFRPTPPRTPEGERAKHEVLNRVRMARSSENITPNSASVSPNPSSFRLQQKSSDSSVSNLLGQSLSITTSQSIPRSLEYPFQHSTSPISSVTTKPQANLSHNLPFVAY